MDDRVNIALRLAAAAKNALDGGDFRFSMADYIAKSRFEFLPRRKSLFGGGLKTDKACLWYDHLENLGLESVYAEFDYRGEIPPCIYCAFEDGSTSRFDVDVVGYKHRHFDGDVGPAQAGYGTPRMVIRLAWQYAHWDCLRADITERSSVFNRKRWSDNTLAFRDILIKAEALAMRLESGGVDCRNHAQRFAAAAAVLDGKAVGCGQRIVPLPELDEEKLRLYIAAEASDIFDVRNGWFNAPQNMAHELGLSEEFGYITAELLTQQRLALLYAVNE